ncbi:flagellar hook-length control protein FliK [Syntrophomonas palmitatica]|uniref:flagellar hook-length control protein FliK n=1 Tax=Syntrophomonas palmitatica TaxID=402877 RepID=UPI0006D14CA7|nr:flagellar hook-length control protein FliK [Syntrophomonas palmitatica]
MQNIEVMALAAPQSTQQISNVTRSEPSRLNSPRSSFKKLLAIQGQNKKDLPVLREKLGPSSFEPDMVANHYLLNGKESASATDNSALTGSPKVNLTIENQKAPDLPFTTSNNQELLSELTVAEQDYEPQVAGSCEIAGKSPGNGGETVPVLAVAAPDALFNIIATEGQKAETAAPKTQNMDIDSPTVAAVQAGMLSEDVPDFMPEAGEKTPSLASNQENPEFAGINTTRAGSLVSYDNLVNEPGLPFQEPTDKTEPAGVKVQIELADFSDTEPGKRLTDKLTAAVKTTTEVHVYSQASENQSENPVELTTVNQPLPEENDLSKQTLPTQTIVPVKADTAPVLSASDPVIETVAAAEVPTVQKKDTGQEKSAVNLKSDYQLTNSVDSAASSDSSDKQRLQALLLARTVPAPRGESQTENPVKPLQTGEILKDQFGKTLESSKLQRLIAFEHHRAQAVQMPDSQNTASLNQTSELVQDSGANLNLLTSIGKDQVGTELVKKDAELPQTFQDYGKLLEQVVQKAELMVKSQTSEMKIQLHPEFLGKMTIKVLMEDGVLTARFITDNHQVKQMLESNLPNLKQTLENHGIRVEKTEVNVQLNNGGTYDGYQEGRHDQWQQPAFTAFNHNRQAKGDDFFLASNEDEPYPESIVLESFGLQNDGSMNLVI